MINNVVKEFIISTLDFQKLSRKEFAEKTGIPYSTVNHLINGTKLNPSFLNIVTIANSFKCSVDQILGIQSHTNTLIKSDISPSQAMHNLRKYIKQRVLTKNLNPRKMSLEAGLSAEAITDFIKSPPAKHSLGSRIITQLAKHWEVSVDEMIGRVERKQEKTLVKPNEKPKSFVEKLKQQRANSANKSKSR